MSEGVRSLPAVLAIEPMTKDDPHIGHGCHCFCVARHPAHIGVCAGFITKGARVHFNSLWAPPEGVPVCGPCAIALGGG